MESKVMFQLNCDKDENGLTISLEPGDYARQVFGEADEWYQELLNRMAETWGCLMTDYEMANEEAPLKMTDYMNIHVKLDDDTGCCAVAYPTKEFDAMYGLSTDPKKVESIDYMLDDFSKLLGSLCMLFHDRAVKITSPYLAEDEHAESITNYFTILTSVSDVSGTDVAFIKNDGLDHIKEELDEIGLKAFDDLTEEYHKKFHELANEYIDKAYALTEE